VEEQAASDAAIAAALVADEESRSRTPSKGRPVPSTGADRSRSYSIDHDDNVTTTTVTSKNIRRPLSGSKAIPAQHQSQSQGHSQKSGGAQQLSSSNKSPNAAGGGGGSAAAQDELMDSSDSDCSSVGSDSNSGRNNNTGSPAPPARKRVRSLAHSKAASPMGMGSSSGSGGGFGNGGPGGGSAGVPQRRGTNPDDLESARYETSTGGVSSHINTTNNNSRKGNNSSVSSNGSAQSMAALAMAAAAAASPLQGSRKHSFNSGTSAGGETTAVPSTSQQRPVKPIKQLPGAGASSGAGGSGSGLQTVAADGVDLPRISEIGSSSTFGKSKEGGASNTPSKAGESGAVKRGVDDGYSDGDNLGDWVQVIFVLPTSNVLVFLSVIICPFLCFLLFRHIQKKVKCITITKSLAWPGMVFM
jgi:hypothetical protein